ncbi:MAG TPA: AraC family transcriptional regulator ligand-binding domain-containing protein [Jatrophihabitantaceae bacterium]|nr:AraC family transcriptional regulator ligand-binding domain-containing protein [Jatrophihabitantaceae bacterium]
MTSRTVPVTFVRAAIEAAAARGVDLAPVAADADIPAALLADSRGRCTSRQVTDFVRGMWRLSEDELFGMGRGPVPRGTFRLLCYALISAPDLATVFTRLTEFGPALPALPGFAVTTTDGTTRVDVDLSGIEDPYHLLTDFLLMFVHRFSGWLIGMRIALRLVELPYPQPNYAAEYDLIFGAPARFGAEYPALEFPSSVLNQPIVRDERDLEAYLQHSPADLLARRDYGTTLSDRVRRILEHGLQGDWPSAADIATQLAISPQHVRRLLRDEGTSLVGIKEELLRDAAIAGLARGETVHALSSRLGFSEPSAFRRAFKRWTGTNPSAYQAERSAGR